MRRLISKTPDTGVEQWYVSDPANGTFRLETVQNVTPHLEVAKNSFNNTDERARWGDIAHVARIPVSVYQTLKQQGIADDPKRMRKWLNDPDHRYFRMRPGMV